MNTQSSAADIQNTFREAVNQSNSRPETSSYKKAFNTLTQSAFGWALLTWLIVFLFLYLLNPPFVQKSESDMSKPTPNITTIMIISSICSCGVLLATKFDMSSSFSASSSVR